MANKAMKDVYSTYRDVTRQSLINRISELIGISHSPSQGATDRVGRPLDYSTKINAGHEATRLSYLLNAVGQGEGGGGGSSSNPFGTGGTGGSVGSGAPTVNTSNRFEAGLSDAELRLKSLLDNPDSINQSAAYKFRVNQGQEALQRSLGAKGLLNSGNRLMELTKYGQDMGSQEYDNQFGRIKDLVGGYSGSWIGDKNANTSLFNAQANAWNQAQANADRNRYQMGMLDVERNKPISGGGGSSRYSAPNSGFSMAAAPSPDAWSYNTGSYDGENSWYTNDRTGAQMARRS